MKTKAANQRWKKNQVIVLIDLFQKEEQTTFLSYIWHGMVGQLFLIHSSQLKCKRLLFKTICKTQFFKRSDEFLGKYYPQNRTGSRGITHQEARVSQLWNLGSRRARPAVQMPSITTFPTLQNVHMNNNQLWQCEESSTSLYTVTKSQDRKDSQLGVKSHSENSKDTSGWITKTASLIDVSIIYLYPYWKLSIQHEGHCTQKPFQEEKRYKSIKVPEFPWLLRCGQWVHEAMHPTRLRMS